jgi:hypothetical protein
MYWYMFEQCALPLVMQLNVEKKAMLNWQEAASTWRVQVRIHRLLLLRCATD